MSENVRNLKYIIYYTNNPFISGHTLYICVAGRRWELRTRSRIPPPVVCIPVPHNFRTRFVVCHVDAADLLGVYIMREA